MTPYTPSTLDLIKRCAITYPARDIAALLGWDEDTLCRRAAAHGIELAHVPTPKTNGHQPRPKPVYRPRPPRPGLPITSDLTLDEITLRLPRRQRQMFTVLRSSINGHFIHGREIARRAGDGMARGAISNCATSLKKRLEKTRWDIEIEFGLHGGYRLVTR